MCETDLAHVYRQLLYLFSQKVLGLETRYIIFEELYFFDYIPSSRK